MVANMRVDDNDGVANMAGMHRAEQTPIRQQISGAIYMHCKECTINKAIV